MFNLSDFFVLENKAEEAKLGKMVALMVPMKVGTYMQNVFARVPGDAINPRDMHITLGLVNSGDPEVIKRTLSILCDKIRKPLKVQIKGFSYYPPSPRNNNTYILHAKADPAPLSSVHSAVLTVLKSSGVDIDNGPFGFAPHITIKYCKVEPDVSQIKPFVITLDNITFAEGPVHHKFMFGK